MASNTSKTRLGKGINSIFGSNVQEMLEEIQQGKSTVARTSGQQQIEISKIRPNPYQPRKVFEPSALEELSRSISVHGVFTPILVKQNLDGYDLIAGERRLKASQLAGRSTIPAIIVDLDEAELMEISLLENIQRENLSAIEEALAYENLIQKLHYTQEQLAAQVGKSREHISNTLRLLKLPGNVQQMVLSQKLSMGHVRALLALKDPLVIEQMALRIQQEHWSVRKTEQEIRSRLKTEKVSGKIGQVPVPLSQECIHALEDFSEQKVEFKSNSVILRLSPQKAEELVQFLNLLKSEQAQPETESA